MFDTSTSQQNIAAGQSRRRIKIGKASCEHKQDLIPHSRKDRHSGLLTVYQSCNTKFDIYLFEEKWYKAQEFRAL